MRTNDAKLGGVYPTTNSGTCFNQAPVTSRNFILGDFFVVAPSSEVRFDEKMTLKEDCTSPCIQQARP